MAIFQQGAFVLDPNETPQSIAKKRALVQSLMMNYGSADSIGEGLGQLFNGIGVGMANRKADKAEKAGLASGAAARSAIMSSLLGGSQAPKLGGEFPSAPAAPSGQTSSAPISATGVDVAKRLQADFGLTPAAAAGFAGNLAHESGNFKTLQEINPMVKGSRGGFGWAQWTGPRRRAYEAWAAENRLDPSSPEANYGFLKHELTNTPEGAVIKALQGVNDPAQAAQIVSDKFLRPGIPHMGSRVSKSQQIANMLMGKDGGVQVASLDPSIGMNAMQAPQPVSPAAQAVNAMASPAPVQQTSRVGRPLYNDPNGGLYSEKTVTFPMNGKWVTFPSVGRDGSIMSEDQVADYVKKNGLIDPITGEKFPTFNTQEEAVSYAKQRSGSLLNGAQQPSPASQPVQMAQAAPQAPQMAIQDAGTPFERMAPQGGGIDMQMLLQQAQNPWLDDQSRSFVNSLIQQEMQKRDPAYQMQQQMDQIGLQKAQLELQQLQSGQPKDPLEAEYKRMQIEKLKAEIAKANSPDARAKLGLNPQYGVDASGNPVLLQIGEDGSAVQTKMPDGVTLSKEPIKLDAGTHFVLLDPITRQPVGQIPKNVQGEAAATAIGKEQGSAQASLPSARITADQTIANIDALLGDPNLSKVSGWQSYLPDAVAGVTQGSETLGLRRRVEQLKGGAFLEAYNGLRGGGQITEVEGKKAEDALARLDTAQSDEDYRKALQDFRDAVETGYRKLEARAGIQQQMAPAQAAPAPAQGGLSLDELLKKY